MGLDEASRIRGYMAVDAARFEALFEQHSRAVQAYCLRRASVSDAYDAAAEVFAIAWRRRRDLPKDDSVLPWLYGVAARVLSNQRRSRTRRTAFLRRLGGLGAYPQPGPEEQVVRSSAAQEVIDALNSLSNADREIVTLIAWEDLTRREAAAALGCSVEAAKKRFQRAVRRLERALGGHPANSQLANPAPKGGRG